MVLAGVALLRAPDRADAYHRRMASITDASKDDSNSRIARQRLFGTLDAFVENCITASAREFQNWNPQQRVEAGHETHNVWPRSPPSSASSVRGVPVPRAPLVLDAITRRARPETEVGAQPAGPAP
jgi:hypothetical protein